MATEQDAPTKNGREAIVSDRVAQCRFPKKKSARNGRLLLAGVIPQIGEMPLQPTTMKSQRKLVLRSPAYAGFASSQAGGLCFTVCGELIGSAYSFQPSGGLLPLAI